MDRIKVERDHGGSGVLRIRRINFNTPITSELFLSSSFYLFLKKKTTKDFDNTSRLRTLDGHFGIVALEVDDFSLDPLHCKPLVSKPLIPPACGAFHLI